jgi:hypothetical protein
LRIRLNASSPTAISLRGDRFAYQQSVYEGPSFGDWPYLVAGKLEYDGEYRLSIRRPLESFQTQSFVVTGAGERLLSASVHRIRLITLDSNTAGLSWNSTPVPRAGLVAAVWSAYSGNRGPATLWLDGKPLLTFNLGASQDFEIAALPYRLCFIAEGLRADKPYGTYALIGPALRAGARLDLSVRYASGMSVEPLFYQLDRKRSAAEQQGLLPRCASSRGAVFMPGIEQVIDASRNNYPEDTGRWRVRVIY